MHRLQELVRLHRQGRGPREVARRLAMSPNTERAYRTALRLACLLEVDPSEEALPGLAELRAAVREQLPVKTPPQQVSSVERWSKSIFDSAARGAMPKAIFDKLVLEDPEFSVWSWNPSVTGPSRRRRGRGERVGRESTGT